MPPVAVTHTNCVVRRFVHWQQRNILVHPPNGSSSRCQRHHCFFCVVCATSCSLTEDDGVKIPKPIAHGGVCILSAFCVRVCFPGYLVLCATRISASILFCSRSSPPCACVLNGFSQKFGSNTLNWATTVKNTVAKPCASLWQLCDRAYTI